MKSIFLGASLFSLSLITVLLCPTPTRAATLSFSATSTLSVGDTFSLNVYASSTDRGFNAAEATVVFPKDIVQVESVDSSAVATIFNFWLALPKFSNEMGTVQFSGGSTHGLLGSDIPILTLHMRAVGTGDALITASDASINASDGNGTNILEKIFPARIVVSPATIVIPPKPKPAPTPAPVTPPQPVQPPQTKPSTVTTPPITATTSPTEKIDLCTGLFGYCEVQFPIIQTVSIKPQKNGSEIFVSGTAPEGTHVHLTLNRYGSFYKEVVAIIKPDRNWEAILSNVYAYGVYSIDARAETAENRSSQPFHWNTIHLLPPYSIYFLGNIFMWYTIADILLGILVVGLSVLFLRTRASRARAHYLVTILTTAMLALVILSGISAFHSRQESMIPSTFWKNTDIPCINREHSYTDVYNSIQLEVFVNNKPITIPAEVGVSPSCVAQINTHDDTGHIHFKTLAHKVTLADLFIVAGIKSIMRPEYTLSGSLNGAPYLGDIGSYQLKNGDLIVLKYTKIK